jgi:hypothetical protein
LLSQAYHRLREFGSYEAFAERAGCGSSEQRATRTAAREQKLVDYAVA